MVLELNITLNITDSIAGFILLILGLIIVFYGRKMVKIITFVIGGIIGALIIYRYIVPWIGVGEPYNYIIPFLGFLISGVLAIVLIQFLGGIIAGYIAYDFIRPYFQDWVAPMIIAVIVFAIVFILFNKILSVGTAVLGALIVSYAINLFIPLGFILSTIIIVILAVVGAYYQLKH